jgi:tail lysozyme
MAASATSSGPVDFDLAAVPEGREEIARLIVKSFADAGFGQPQQLAALANAIAESGLNSKAVSASPEQAVGLFQLSSRTGGLGAGHTVAELEDPATNNIILSEAKKIDEFAKTESLEDAVNIFVRKIERPPNPSGEVSRRLKIAQQLVQTG